MIGLPQRRYWLPLTLGLLGLLLLLRVLLVDAFNLTPQFLPLADNIDLIVLVALLSVAMILAIHTLVRISMNHLRLRSIQRVRRTSLAEHRRFLSRLDHELKNPLTAIQAGIHTLALTGLDEQQRQIVETLKTETRRLSQLVTDLRKLADLEAQPLNLQPIALASWIETIVQIEQERFAAGQRTLTSSVEAAQPDWLGDADLLALAIHNLLDNAFKYTQPGDSVRLEVRAHHELMICVADSGIGIPPSGLPHVWEELYRAQPVEQIPGSGIGLPLVKSIVEHHNGRVAIESEPEQGTTITLRLPDLSRL